MFPSDTRFLYAVNATLRDEGRLYVVRLPVVGLTARFVTLSRFPPGLAVKRLELGRAERLLSLTPGEATQQYVARLDQELQLRRSQVRDLEQELEQAQRQAEHGLEVK